MPLVRHAVAGPKFGVETVHGAFLIGNKQPQTRSARAALPAAIFHRVTGTSALNGFARSRALRTNMCVSTHASPHYVAPIASSIDHQFLNQRGIKRDKPNRHNRAEVCRGRPQEVSGGRHRE
jgi:hypothetical protein